MESNINYAEPNNSGNIGNLQNLLNTSSFSQAQTSIPHVSSSSHGHSTDLNTAFYPARYFLRH